MIPEPRPGPLETTLLPPVLELVLPAILSTLLAMTLLAANINIEDY